MQTLTGDIRFGYGQQSKESVNSQLPNSPGVSGQADASTNRSITWTPLRGKSDPKEGGELHAALIADPEGKAVGWESMAGVIQRKSSKYTSQLDVQYEKQMFWAGPHMITGVKRQYEKLKQQLESTQKQLR